MTNKFDRVLLTILACLGPASALHAFVVHVPYAVWPDGLVPMQLQLGIPNGYLIDGNTTWGAPVEAALNDWNLYLGRIQFTAVPDSSASRALGNGLNNVFFSASVYDDVWGPRVLSITLNQITGSVRTESDVLFNSSGSWDSFRGKNGHLTSSGVELNDIKRFALHEFGFVLGLDTPPPPAINSVLSPAASLPNVDSLQADDIAGAKFLYGFPSTAAVITSQPADLTASVGSTASFTVVATGTAPLTYQWRKGAASIAGATSATLTLTNVQFGDAGFYSVFLSNPSGVVTSENALLTVVAAAPPPPPPTRISNVSVRTNLASAQTLTLGIVTSGPKSLVIRAIGPGLTTTFGLTGVYPDPKLSVFDNVGTLIDQNDDWNSGLTQTFASVAAFPLVAGSKDAALVNSVNGSSTIQCNGTGSGIVLVEAYDTDSISASTHVTNVSARNQVGTGSDILICGFVVDGTASRQVLLRGIGPALHDVFGVNGVLADPVLEIHQNVSGQDTVVASNDNWDASLATVFDQVGAYRFSAGSKDAALLITLLPGVYTAQVYGVNGGTGDGVVEIYLLP